MSRWLTVLPVGLLALSAGSCRRSDRLAQPTGPDASQRKPDGGLLMRPPPDPVDAAEQFIDLVAEGEYEAACSGPDLISLSAEWLKRDWEYAVAESGPYQGRVRSRAGESFRPDDVMGPLGGVSSGVTVTCQFERGQWDAHIALDGDQVIEYYLWPVYEPPGYARLDAFSEEESDVSGAGIRVTRCAPAADSPVPGVVLFGGVGSGPMASPSRDLRVGRSMPFRDLAYGLASRGIAVLRYESVPQIAPPPAGSPGAAARGSTPDRGPTVTDEAVAALEALRAVDDVDPGRVFILGHGTGGSLAPRVAAADASVAGLIIMAGRTRSLAVIDVEWQRHVLAVEGDAASVKQRRHLRTLDKEAARAGDPKLSLDTLPEKLPRYRPASFWLDVQGYDPARAAADLHKPMLILQAGRDCLVTGEDLKRWKDALSGREDVTFRTYQDLNHLFIPGSGWRGAGKRCEAGYVPEQVVADIADWITKH